MTLASAATNQLTLQIFSLLRESVLAYTSDGQIVFANTTACERLNLSQDELIGEEISTILPELSEIPTDKTNFVLPIASKNSNALPLEFDQHQLTHDGTTWHVLVASTCTTSSIGELKNDSRIRDFAESAADWFWEMDKNLKYTYFSDRVFKISGYSKNELLGKNRLSFVSKKWLKENRTLWNAHQESIKRHQAFHNFDYIMVRKSGTDLHIQLSGIPNFDKNGLFSGYRGAARDITTLKQSALKLEQSEKQLRAILESSPIGVGISYREDSVVEFVNRRTEALMGAAPGGLIGVRADQFWADPNQQKTFENEFDQEGRVPSREVRLRKLDGSEFWSLLTWESVNIQGRAAILFWIYDIDHLKSIQTGLALSEQRFRSILELASDWFWETDAQHRFTFISESFLAATDTDPATILGRTREEIVGIAQGEMAREPEKWRDHLDDLKQHRAFQKFIYQIEDKQGQTRHIQLSGSPYYSPEGDFLGFRGAGTNVTVDEALRISEERFRTMLATTKEGFLALDTENRITEVNPALCAMLGHSEEHLQGLSVSELATEQNKKMVLSQFSLLKKQSNLAFEIDFERDNSLQLPVLIHSTALQKENKNSGSFAFISDLSEQKKTAKELQRHRDQLEVLVKERTEELEESNSLLVKEASERKQVTKRLEASESRLSQIIDFLPEAMFVIDTQGTIITWNRAMEEMTGALAKNMLGKSNYEYALPFYGDRRPAMIDLVQAWDDDIAATYHNMIRDGDTLSSETPNLPLLNNAFFWNSARPLYNTSGAIVGAIEVIRDITTLKAAEEGLFKAQQYVEDIFNSMPSALIGVDQGAIVTQWNTEAKNITGKASEIAVGKALSEVFPQLWISVEKLKKNIADGQPTTERIRKSDIAGSIQHWDVTVYPLLAGDNTGAVIRIDDITSKVNMEEMIVQSEKMLSVGGLAAGMAHEINNPLAGMLQSMQVLKIRLKAEQKKNQEVAESCGTKMDVIQEYMEKRGLLSMLDSVSQSGKRAAQIVHNMLSFSRKDDHSLEMADLAAIIDNTIELAANDYDLRQEYDFRNIQINREFSHNLVPIPCHPSKIQQVILNLLRNGAQEMASHKTTTHQFIIRLKKKGNMIQLEVEDNGPGMKERVRKRVFEPFFTTKSVATGTGLGLSVSYFIVTENHQGKMAVESTPGKGTKFIIQLPITPKGI